METCDSPSGRFGISISAWEVRMSLWIETPLLCERRSGQRLLVFKDSNWSLNSAEWLSDSVVVRFTFPFAVSRVHPQLAWPGIENQPLFIEIRGDALPPKDIAQKRSGCVSIVGINQRMNRRNHSFIGWFSLLPSPSNNPA